MTPLERADAIVAEYAPRLSTGPGARVGLRDAIHKAIIENSNLDRDRRVNLENEIAGLRVAGIQVLATAERTTLRVWNPIRKAYAEVSMTEFPGKDQSV